MDALHRAMPGLRSFATASCPEAPEACMSVQAMNFVAHIKVETAGEKSMLYAMARRHNHITWILQISESEIAHTSGLTKRRVIDLLKALEQRSVIRCTRKGKGRSASC